MGKYEDEIMCLERIFVQDKFSTTALDLEEVEEVVAKADVEIAQLQREKAELEEKLQIEHEKQIKADTDYLNEALAHSKLVERVKVHNENIANMDKHFPSSNWETYLIDLD